jgi:hypothetical protein
MTSACTELREGDAVCFTLKSVYLPSSDEAHALLGPADQVLGTIVHFSESDGGERDFAVVSLAGRSNVVVPVEKLVRVTFPEKTE